MIKLTEISLRRGEKLLLDESHLCVYPGWKVGITGANGCGKSSLFALLRDSLQADIGNISIPAQWQVAHVAQETPQSDQTALAYTLAGDVRLMALEAAVEKARAAGDGLEEAHHHADIDAIDGYRAPARAAQILNGLGFNEAEMSKSVNEFSGGWRMRLNLAQTLMRQADLLLLDEPTNHLDLDAVLWFELWLQRYPGTLLLISHDRDFLNSVTQHIVHIEHQKINLYTGNYDAFEKQRAEKLAQQQAGYEKQQVQIKHLEQFVQRFKAKASKAKQAQSRVKTLEKMTLISAAHIDSPFHFEFMPAPSQTSPLLNLSGVNVGYLDDQPILSKIRLQLIPGSRIGLLGANGAGKSTLIKLLAGLLSPQQGRYDQSADLRIGYFAQHQLELLHPEESPLAHLQRQNPAQTEQAARRFLGGFNFIGDMALAPTAPFSGGEKARLALALIIAQGPNLLLLDEPTNHLDLEMRHALTLALQNYEGALVVVSHDRHLLRATTDQFYLVDQGNVSAFEGSLDEYRDWLLKRRDQAKRDQPKISKAPLDKQHVAKQRNARRQQENKLKKLEQQLATLETEKAGLSEILADPDLYQDQAKAKQYVQQDMKISQALLEIEEQWLEISEALEAE